MKYHNLDLEAFDYQSNEAGEGFRVRVAASPAGEQRLAEAEEVTLPSNLRKRLRQLEKRALHMSDMIALGEDLAAALFPPRARLFLDRSRARIGDDVGMRIRLKIDSYALADLPWEYVYVPRPDTPATQKGPDGFLVLDRRISLVRYEVMGQSPGSLSPLVAGSLRLVALMANAGRLAPLNLAAEQRNLEQALAKLSDIQAEFFPEATIDVLQEALVRDAHIFHFAGHGRFDIDMGAAYGSREGTGYLVLRSEDGQEALFSAPRLALNLTGRGVRLAVLGACEAGRRDGLNAWTGIAPALTRAGIPAVVGMQYTICDANAIAFSKRFYRALAAGQSIDAAMTDGRLAIFNRSDEDERDWGVPVLYLRAEEGVLFPRLAEDQPASAAIGTRLSQPVVSMSTPRPSITTPLAPPDANVDQRALRTAMVQTFSLDELDVLCSDIQADLRATGSELVVNMEMVGGSTKVAKVLNLIQYLDRRGQLPALIKAVRSARPGII